MFVVENFNVCANPLVKCDSYLGPSRKLVVLRITIHQIEKYQDIQNSTTDPIFNKIQWEFSHLIFFISQWIIES